MVILRSQQKKCGVGRRKGEIVVRPIHEDTFFHNGRGPSLERVHWAGAGQVLEAIDYSEPGTATPRHLRFIRPQVVAITAEEVIDYARVPHFSGQHGRAALFDLGSSEWVASFAPRHLGRCRHYQVFFYDELLDVICEGVEIHPGTYRERESPKS
jgi:hypothetical protein